MQVSAIAGMIVLLSLASTASFGAGGPAIEAAIPPSLERLDWLAGHWEGEAFGGRFEEVWLAPEGGSMAGMFRLLGSRGLQLLELQMIVQYEDRLEFRLKHFNAKFHGWEPADEWVAFPFLRQTESGLYFDGLSFERRGEDEILVTLFTSSDGEPTKHEMTYRRKRAD